MMKKQYTLQIILIVKLDEQFQSGSKKEGENVSKKLEMDKVSKTKVIVQHKSM